MKRRMLRGGTCVNVSIPINLAPGVPHYATKELWEKCDTGNVDYGFLYNEMEAGCARDMPPSPGTVINNSSVL